MFLAPADIPRVVLTRNLPRLGCTRAEARTLVRHRQWQALAIGVLLTRPDGPTRADWAHAGVLLGGSSAAVSGWDAVQVWGVGPRRPSHECVLVLTRAGKNRVVGGVHLRPTTRAFDIVRSAPDNRLLPGLPVVRPARAIADTALTSPYLDPVRAMVTKGIQRGLCTPEQLASELHASARNGSAHLRRAMKDILDNVRSVAEAKAVDALKRAAVPAFEVNVPVVDATGTRVFVVDVYWRALRAVLEIDSREFHYSEAEWKATGRRHNRLTREGLALTHYAPSEVIAGGTGWAAEVAAWLRARASEIGVAYTVDPRVIRPGTAGHEPIRIT